MSKEDVVVARRVVVRRALWDEVSRVADETGLSVTEVMERAVEAGAKILSAGGAK